MDDKNWLGKIVYLTVHSEVWFKEINPNFNIPMVNRLAKIVKVFDWDTEEGKILLEAREKTGKWGKLNSKDFKFVLKIYYPELIFDPDIKIYSPEMHRGMEVKKGFVAEEVLPLKYPGTELFMFDLLPDWVIKDLVKEEKVIFKVIKGN